MLAPPSGSVEVYVMRTFASDVQKILMISFRKKTWVLVLASSCAIRRKKPQIANLLLVNTFNLVWIGLERRLPVLSELVTDLMVVALMKEQVLNLLQRGLSLKLKRASMGTVFLFLLETLALSRSLMACHLLSLLYVKNYSRLLQLQFLQKWIPRYVNLCPLNLGIVCKRGGKGPLLASLLYTSKMFGGFLKKVA